MAIGNRIHPSEPRVWQPSGLREAWELRQNLQAASTFVSGGSLLRTQWESGQTEMPMHLISLEGISELQGLRVLGNRGDGVKLRIGSLVRLAACGKQAESRLLAEACRLIAAPSVRNIGTLGGNVASGIGDAIPALLVNDAILSWFNGKGIVAERLESWLAGRRKGKAGEDKRILAEIVLQPVPVKGSDTGVMEFYHKAARREAFAPSLVTVAGTGILHQDGSLSELKLAAGGGSSTACRLPYTEALLTGRPLTESLLKQAHDLVKSEWSGFADPFAAAEYRRTAAANLIVSELWKQMTAKR